MMFRPIPFIGHLRGIAFAKSTQKDIIQLMQGRNFLILKQSFTSQHPKKGVLYHKALNYFERSTPSWNGHPCVRIPYVRAFHTSPRRAIHPAFWLIAKPAAKLISMISGRSFRNWWKGLSDVDKVKFKNKVYQSRGKIAAAIGVLIAGGALNYWTHIQETPITHRKRYIAFTDEQFLKIAQFEFDMQWVNLQEKVMDPSTAEARKVYDTITRVAQRLIDSNQHLELLRKQKWSVIVVDDDEPNAFVLPTGHIFVYKGILKLTQNEDQLAVVLGHEISHVILSHGAEKVSFAGLLDVGIVLILAALWAFVPSDGIAIITQWFYNKVMDMLIHLPYSRKLENEADEVGLQLMARACYDVRESSTFWERMALNDELWEKDGESVNLPEWMSTHPASHKRADSLNELIPKAMETREICMCPKLSKPDPRLGVTFLREIMKQKATKETEQADVGKGVLVEAKPA